MLYSVEILGNRQDNYDQRMTMGQCNNQTPIGGFSCTMIDIETGEITVLLDGAPIAKKLELLKDVANSDNRIIGRGKGKYGFRRIMGTESIVLTVRMNQRTHDKMSKIFKTFVNNVRDIIEQNPDMATEICRVRCVPNITEEMYAMMRGNVPSISNDDRQ